MNKEQYELVVKTDCWKLRKESYLKKSTGCEVCGNPREPLEVHHLTYERIGKELDSDLVAICKPCHKLLHGLPGAQSPQIALGNLQYQAVSEKRKNLIEQIIQYTQQ